MHCFLSCKQSVISQKQSPQLPTVTGCASSAALKLRQRVKSDGFVTKPCQEGDNGRNCRQQQQPRVTFNDYKSNHIDIFPLLYATSSLVRLEGQI